ncbi:hypothetical protein WJX73_003934 [Symbiochloris irregularis]|uniref:BZIP domain-containing protein n=1 Tax=Symbiochloris irregularis TaxID=706552 RepID=A0AAW1NN61_9CHLO
MLPPGQGVPLKRPGSDQQGPGSALDLQPGAEGKSGILTEGVGDPSAAGALGSDGGGSGEIGGVRTGGVKCAKEKNRQAQRRFRERQKGLISALKERADALARQVEDQARNIEALEKENMLLKAMMGDSKLGRVTESI